MKSNHPHFTPPSAAVEQRITGILVKLTLEEKIDLLGGKVCAAQEGGTHGNERAGIPALRFADASVGIHWWTDRSTTYPATIALAATWDRDLAYRAGAALASTMDFIPTMLGLAGLPLDTPLDGTSLVAALDDPAATPREEVFIEFNRYGIGHSVTGGFWPIRCIRTARWKLTINCFDTDELYDLETDPGELRNRINDPACAPIRDGLHDRLLRYLDRVQDPLRGHCWAGRPWRTNPPIHFTIA